MTLAEDLAGRPELFDGLDRRERARSGWRPFTALMREMAGWRAITRRELDHVRRVSSARSVLRWGHRSSLAVADPLARVGWLCAGRRGGDRRAGGKATIAEFAVAHMVTVPGSELVILALGRLGGGALTHASDLDLIYLFTGDYLAESERVANRSARCCITTGSRNA